MKKHVLFNLLFIALSPWILEIGLEYFGNSAKLIKKKHVTVQKNYILKQENKIKIDELKKQGYHPTAYPSVLSKRLIYKNLMIANSFLPLGAQPNTKTYLCDEGYGFIKFKTDYLGFRNNNEDWVGDKKLALIGDSYVHGSCVDDNFTISGHLKTKGIKNINLGIGNHQSAHYYQTIDQFIIDDLFQNVVVLFSLHNDLMGADEGDKIYLNNFNSYIFNKDKNKFQLSDGGKNFYSYLEKNLSKIKNEEERNVRNFLKLERLRVALRVNYGIWINKDLFCFKKFCIYGSLEKRFNNELTVVKKTISKLLKRCNPTTKCNPMVILLHHPKFYDHDIMYNYRRIYFNKFVNEIKIKNTYLNYIDSSLLIDSNLAKNYAIAGSHFSPYGYELIADMISNNLK